VDDDLLVRFERDTHGAVRGMVVSLVPRALGVRWTKVAEKP